ncbi:MAG: pyruvate dehydrogenase complex E1 component subunit beta [Spirochaetae bacterium HGW-Spirochaetae-10]|jgi:pyruvate dehydrogenase E1 component beta subunit|nr:MAG: pyruvate dehydrogenase complex E1 component subunit beta [Spirochaetae bacterium HGW-Spirochaetae-10]
MAVISYREALRRALDEEMERDNNVFLMGEEVGAYQGAYKVSQGLLEKYGEKRVVDTPISEQGFAGLGVGAAMCGLRPVIEFMTWNFSLVAIDQIYSNAAKLFYMSGGQIPIPMVFRAPAGAGGMLAAQHSQALESIYVHCPGLIVVAPATPADACGLLKSSIRDNNPVIFIEGEVLYGMTGEVPDQEFLVPIGKAEVKKEGRDFTIITWSRGYSFAIEAMDAIQKLGYDPMILDLRSLRPMDEQAVIEAATSTGRVLIIEEGWPRASMGSHVADFIQRNCFYDLHAPILRVTQEDVPMPYARNLEKLSLPNPVKIVQAVEELMKY